MLDIRTAEGREGADHMKLATDITRRVWEGIEADNPPAMRHDFDQLQAMAQRMLAARQKGFPALVAAGEKSEADAQAEIALFEDLVADWTFIASAGAEGEPASRASIEARRRALDASIATIAGIAAQQGGFSKTLGAQAEAVIALRWHLEPGRDQVALARLTHQLRAEAAAANSREPAQ